MSLPMDSKVTAVDSRNLYLNYSKGKSKVIALNNLSLSIPSGCIFCLIGPSGCGKTSYLRTLIGLIKTQSGSTTIFGHPLGHRDLMIPGRDLGYMPQDIALNDDLTIGEMLNYFNRLLNTYSSSASQNNKVIDHNHTNRKLNDNNLLSNLSLPSKDTLIGSLSGGQKRRVSFLCSILHSPKLIILDEPTVGCDPVVICSMWKLLHSITSTGQSTVIITTHYLEEARRTDIIGFMRKGQLLESGSPAQVLNRLSVNSIEAAFALMCQQFKKNKKNRPSIQQDELNLINVVKNTQLNLSKQMTDQSLDKSSTNQENSSHFSFDWFRQSFVVPLIVYLQLTYAMTHRLCLRQNKIKGLFLGSTIVTIFLIGLTILCNGRTPIVSIGVVNNEQENNGSKIFLNKINQQLLHLISYNSSELAHHDTLDDKLSGYLTISSQFTPELISKYTFNDNKLIASKPAMVFNGDAIKLVVLNTIIFILESALDESLPEIMNSLGINPILGSPYAIIVDPIAKADSPNDLYNSRNHWIPKFVVFWSFTVTIFLSTFTFYRDRNEPFFDRNLSSGATKGQFVIGHFITSLVVPLVNSWPVLLISVYFLGLQQKGSLIIVWLIYISNCSTAIVSAFLIASAPIDAFFVFVLSSTYVFCGLASTGIVWPFHALPYFFKPFTKWIPLTVNYDSLIRVLSHGHPWNDPVVLWGLAHNLGYVVIILMIVRFIL